jgi:tetratricopeptide (TPR) repeat protein
MLRKAVAVLLVVVFAAACAAEAPKPTSSTTASSVLLAAAGQSHMGVAAPRNSPYGNYLAGLVASQERDLSAAADFMLTALDSDPENLALLRRTFSLVASDGRHQKAVELARRVLIKDPGDAMAGLVLAVDFLQADQAPAATTLINGLPDRSLSAISKPMLKAWLQVDQGQLEAALATLATLDNTKGFEVVSSLQAALLNDVAGGIEAASADYAKALEQSAAPSLQLVLLAGNFYERHGLTEQARQAYQRYADISPGSTLLEPASARLATGSKPPPLVDDVKTGWAEVLFTMSSLLSQEQAADLALIHSHLALRLNPGLNVARLLQGEILADQERSNAAIAVFRQVDPASPLAWNARLRIADELNRLERTDEAIAELESLAAERPADFEPLYRVGNLLRNQQKFDESVDAYDRAFERVSAPEQQHWSMHYFRGIALERSDQWERAEKDFLAALKLEPEQPYVMNYLAYSWVEKQRHLDQAKSMLARAVQLRPDDGFIVDSLGWVYYRLEEFDKAVIHLERAVELRSQDPVINDHLGDAYWQVGRRQEARFQWRRSLSLEPEQDLIPAIEAKIKRGLIDEPKKI